MNRFFLIFLIVTALFLVSCDGGSGSEKCPAGYSWNGSECEKDDVINPDNNPVTDNDSNTVDDNVSPDDDAVEDDSDTTDDENPYTGDCIEIKKGGNLDINIETKTLTIGEVTLSGSADDANLYGELWGENRSTLSEFKIADIDGNLSGKKFSIPKGRYTFSFKNVASDNKMVILEDIDMASGDRTLDMDIPLVHFTGAVLKNGGAFTVEAGMETSTKITLRSGTYEKEIAYADFAAFDVVLPKGKYSVYFEGELNSGEGIYKGTVLAAADGIEISDTLDQNIDVTTVTFSGNAVNEGYDVSTGQIIIVETPPFDDPSAVIIPDLATKSYSVTMTTGAAKSVLYLPETDSYPVKYITIEKWEDLSTGKTHNIILDFGRIHGSITFLGGANLPSVSKCEGADCSRGKLKVVGFDYSSLLIKDFGTEGVDLTYEAFIIRRTKTDDPETPYLPKKYSMTFESHLNNVSGCFQYSPFTVPLKYLNADSAMVSTFTIQNAAEEYLLEKEINFNIAPMLIEGTVTLNGTAITTDKEDLIKLRNENSIETPVINISELTDGTFSFMVPTGDYEVIYEGEGVLGTFFRTHIEKDFTVSGNMTGEVFAMSTAKMNLGMTVNGTPFKDWIENDKTVKAHRITINPDKTAAQYSIDTVKQTDAPYYGEVLTGGTLNAFLDIYFESVGENDSFMRIPLLASHNMGSDTNIEIPLKLTDYTTSIKLNGKEIAGASDYTAVFKISGQNRTEIFYSPTGSETKAYYKTGEHKSPIPEIVLNDGFDTLQAIELDCLYFGE